MAGERDFILGVAAGLASIARDRDEPSLAADALRGLGIDAADLRRAKVDAFDLDPLLAALASTRPPRFLRPAPAPPQAEPAPGCESCGGDGRCRAHPNCDEACMDCAGRAGRGER